MTAAFRLWVTRSQPAADRLASVLTEAFAAQSGRAARFEAVVQPLLAIESVSWQTPERVWDAVVVVSGNAARQLSRASLSAHRWFSVGRATADVLAPQLGVNRRDIAVPDDERSEGLLPLLRPLALSGGAVLVVAGEGGRTLLAEQLAAWGAEVATVQTYRRVPSGERPKQRVDAVEIASEAALERWLQLDTERSQPVFTPSQRLADLAAAKGCQNVHNVGSASPHALANDLRKLLDTR